MAFDPAKARPRAAEGQAHPAPDHRPVPPAGDVARDAAHGPDEVLDASGGREEAPQPRRQLPLQDGEGLLQALAQARGRVIVPVARQPRGEGVPLAARRRGRARAVGPLQHPADIGLPRPRDQGQEIARFVHLAVLADPILRPTSVPPLCVSQIQQRSGHRPLAPVEKSFSSVTPASVSHFRRHSGRRREGRIILVGRENGQLRIPAVYAGLLGSAFPPPSIHALGGRRALSGPRYWWGFFAGYFLRRGTRDFPHKGDGGNAGRGFSEECRGALSVSSFETPAASVALVPWSSRARAALRVSPAALRKASAAPRFMGVSASSRRSTSVVSFSMAFARAFFRCCSASTRAVVPAVMTSAVTSRSTHGVWRWSTPNTKGSGSSPSRNLLGMNASRYISRRLRRD